MRKIILFALIIALSFTILACQGKEIGEQVSSEKILGKNWDQVLEASKGKTVNFYGWGGDERTNKWLDTVVANTLKEQYDIQLNRVPMDIDDILNKLLGDKQVNNQKGSIDIVWINGENFYTAKKNDLLFGPFTDVLPNFKQYIDGDSDEVKYDFGYEVEGYEAPYGKAQLVLMYDKEKVPNPPRDHQALLAFVKENPGKVTYPAPPDFTGSAFVRNIMYDISGYKTFLELQEEDLEEALEPAMTYFEAIKPYLWRKGETYPATIAQLNNMFVDGEILLGMSYTPYYASGQIENGQYPESIDTYVFDKGTIGNTHFLAIPFNAQNKEAAMVAINAIESVELQASKYDPANWGDLPVLEYDKLNEDEKKLFTSVSLGKGAIPQNLLAEHRVPEMPARLVPEVEKIWMSRIPKKGE